MTGSYQCSGVKPLNWSIQDGVLPEVTPTAANSRYAMLCLGSMVMVLVRHSHVRNTMLTPLTSMVLVLDHACSESMSRHRIRTLLHSIMALRSFPYLVTVADSRGVLLLRDDAAYLPSSHLGDQGQLASVAPGKGTDTQGKDAKVA